MPAAPTVTQALCRGGVVGDAALAVGPTDGITYTFSVPAALAAGDVGDGDGDVAGDRGRVA